MKQSFLRILRTFTGVLVIATCIFVCIHGCGGSSTGSSSGSGTGSSSVTVSISPSASSTSVSGISTIKATFSAAITEPLSWFNLIRLQKGGSGDTLCSGVSYDADSRTVTCGHDTLDENASYTVTVSGLKDASDNCVDDASETFTTSAAAPISSVEKTSITSTSGGSVDITFHFASALSSGVTASVAVSSDEDASVSAGDCTLSGDRTACTVTISSVNGCATPTDYEVTLSLTGYETYSTSFNSADNEFESAATVASNSCWEQDYLPSAASAANYSWTASGGNLVLAVSNVTEERNIYYDHVFASDKEGAFAVYVLDLTSPVTAGSVIDLILVQATNSDFEGLNGIMSGYNGVAAASYTGWLSVYQATGSSDLMFGKPDASGDLGDTDDLYEGFYVCQTANNNTLTTYFSTDGENYVKLTEDNMTCADSSASCDLDQIDTRSISTWDDVRLSIQLGSNNDDGNGFSASFGFARFRTDHLNGTMADCPRMTR